MNNNKICYVTAYTDIGRDSWNDIFSRSFDVYLNGFIPLVNLFRKSSSDQYELIAFIDKRYYKVVSALTENIKNIENIRLIPTDKEFIEKLPVWSRYEREKEIMNSVEYKELVKNRNHPETKYPEYTLINHAKIDFINLALSLTDCYYFCWIDFGYFANTRRKLYPQSLVDVRKVDCSKICYGCLNHIVPEVDFSIINTLVNPHEKVAGGFFICNRDNIGEYTVLYNEVLDEFSKLNVADDDQHVVLQCFKRKPGLFSLIHTNGEWKILPFWLQT